MRNFLCFLLLGFILIIPVMDSFAQVSISNDNTTPDPSAMLEVKSSDRGFLPPRIALVSVNSADPVTSPATGLLVYNTAIAGTTPYNVSSGFYYWDGTIWVSLAPPKGNNPGDMLYWSGMQWAIIPADSPGKFLQLSQGNIPVWSGNAYARVITTAISSITATSAVSGGNVESDGGSVVTARGVCWSKLPNPTIANSKTTDGTGTGVFTSSITGLELFSTYYVRAYATNSTGTSYGNEQSFKTQYLPLGSNYQGGKIAYIFLPGDPGYIDGEEHGLIAAPSDQSTGIQWYNGSYLVTGATGAVLGTGNVNTNIIVASQGAGSYAARLCYDLELGGYSDWYLPSKDELHKLFQSQGIVGGYTGSFYWSSSENDAGSAWCEQFPFGYQYIYGKNNSFWVRAIRSF